MRCKHHSNRPCTECGEFDVVCSECDYFIDNDCDNPDSDFYGENVDGITVCCELFKTQ